MCRMLNVIWNQRSSLERCGERRCASARTEICTRAREHGAVQEANKHKSCHNDLKSKNKNQQVIHIFYQKQLGKKKFKIGRIVLELYVRLHACV